MGKHAAPDNEQPELEDPELEYQLRHPDFPGWQVGLGIAFVIFFALLGFWRILLEFIV